MHWNRREAVFLPILCFGFVFLIYILWTPWLTADLNDIKADANRGEFATLSNLLETTSLTAEITETTTTVMENQAIESLYLSAAFPFRDERQPNGSIRITAMAPRSLHSASLFCTNDQNERTPATVFTMGGALPCSWWEYFVDCPFESTSTWIHISGDEVEDAVTLPVENTHSSPVELAVCYSRMFAFENWQMAVASLESYLHHGAQILSAPIVSVDSQLFRFLELYVAAGVLDLRAGVRMPNSMEAIDGNPNEKTEFFNQVISNSECLYKFRDSAEFIIFADVDDVLIPRDHESIVEEMRELRQLYPNVVAFEFLWAKRSVVRFDKTPEEFNITRMFSHIYLNDTQLEVGKTVALSRHLTAGLMHHITSPQQLTPQGVEFRRMTENDMLAVHFRVPIFSDAEWNFPPNAYFQNRSFDQIDSAFRRRLQQMPNSTEIFLSLPAQRQSYDQLADCYVRMKEELLRKGNDAECPNALRCQPILRNCTMLEVRHQRAAIGNLRLYAPKRWGFVRRERCDLTD